MLSAYAPGEKGNILFLGFDPSDLAHLLANKPISVDAARFGVTDKPVVILFETDPMVDFYAAQPWVVIILFRQSTIDALRKGGGFVQIDLAHPTFPPNTLAMLFFGEDDDALLGTLRATGLVSPDLQATDDASEGPSAAPPSRSSVPQASAPAQEEEASPAPNAPHWTATLPGGRGQTAVAATLSAILSAFLLVAPWIMRVESVPRVLAFGVLFGVIAGGLFWALWRSGQGGARNGS